MAAGWSIDFRIFYFYYFCFWRTVNCKIYWSLFPKKFLALHQNWFPNTYCSVREVFNTKLMLDQTQTLRDCLNFFRDGLFFKISFGILRKLFSAFAPALVVFSLRMNVRVHFHSNCLSLCG